MLNKVRDPGFKTYAASFHKETDMLKINAFIDRTALQKLATQEEKIQKLHEIIVELNQVTDELKTTKFRQHPIKKYRNYKKMITVSEKLKYIKSTYSL